ncbi:MAG TPA: 23S rRNA (guanosine(2251)-2'-O)-methyltransferase RlmB [Phenylobacterium sp.]|nr:23S rRNA (guanosine(2251)-2'-O)-methyltransferase RlmB [Phenylobacterium sp.]
MASHNERNAGRRPAKKGPGKPAHQRFQPRHAAVSDDWLWGWHAVAAALENPARPAPQRLLATADRAREIERRFGRPAALEIVDAQLIGQNLPQGAVHQGVALRVAEPEPLALEDFEARPGAVLLVLDQVTDPQNVGAILRSAAAFGAAGVILQDRHAPKLTGALAKAAAGAVDKVPTARVINLSRALETLAEAGWRAVGLDGQGERTLAEALDGAPTVLVLGSEGEGLRRLVSEHCDELARIPMPGGFESLNVAAAAAVALYEAARPRKPLA